MPHRIQGSDEWLKLREKNLILTHDTRTKNTTQKPVVRLLKKSILIVNKLGCSFWELKLLFPNNKKIIL